MSSNHHWRLGLRGGRGARACAKWRDRGGDSRTSKWNLPAGSGVGWVSIARDLVRVSSRRDRGRKVSMCTEERPKTIFGVISGYFGRRFQSATCRPEREYDEHSWGGKKRWAGKSIGWETGGEIREYFRWLFCFCFIRNEIILKDVFHRD